MSRKSVWALVALLSTAAFGQVPEDWFVFEPANTPAAGEVGMADWLEKPAGRHGHVVQQGDRFVFADGTPVKFWGVNLGNLDCAPDPQKGIAWADRYAKYGVNCVRLHKFVPDLMVPQSSTRIDPARAERFDLFTKALVERGMYYGFSWIFEHKVRPEDRTKLLNYDEIVAAGGNTHRVLVFIAEDVQDLRIEMLRNLLNRRNAHTGMRYADDPALAFVEFQNEDSIFFYTFQALNDPKLRTYRERFVQKYSDWLRTRYGSEEKLRAAWGPNAWNAFSEKSESLDRRNIAIEANPHFFTPGALEQAAAAGTRQRLLDNARFLYEVQDALYAKFAKAIRETGYKGPLVPSCWVTPGGIANYYNLLTDARHGFVDRHDYFGGLPGWEPKPGKFNAESQLGAPGTGLLAQAVLQVKDRPFALSEWNTVFPNAWAPESYTIVAAYGLGLQGWDASFAFASHINERDTIGFSPTLDSPRLWNIDVPNQVGLFPALARMVLRGDVRQGSIVSTRRVSEAELAHGRPEWLRHETVKVSAGLGDFKEITTAGAVEAPAVGRVVVEFTPQPMQSDLPGLGGHIKNGVLVSTTGQLRWTRNAPGRGWISIDTPGTQAAVGFLPREEIVLESVSIRAATPFAAIYVSAPGREDRLENAGSALVTAVAQVRNTGMRFSAAGDELLEVGTAPMRMEPVRARLSFKRKIAAVERLDHDGLRTGTRLPLIDEHTVAIDGARDRTLYYRVEFSK